MGITSDVVGGIIAEPGRIVSVDVRSYTCSVMTEANMLAEGVEYGSLMQHPDHPGGAHFVPEEGAEVWLSRMPDGSAKIFAYRNRGGMGSQPYVDENGDTQDGAPANLSYAHNRPALEQGDLQLGTRDGNTVRVLRGGIIELYSAALASLTLIPVDNIVRVCFQKLQMRSPLGEIDWGHVTLVHSGGENPSDTTKETPVIVRYSIKELAQEDVTKGHYTVEARFGRLDKTTLDPAVDNEHIFRSKAVSAQETNILGNTTPTDKGIVSIVCWSHETDTLAFCLQVNRDGHAFIRTAGNLHVETDGVAYLYSAKQVRLQVQKALIDLLGDSMTVDCKTGKITLKAATIALEASTSVTLSAGASSLTVAPGGIVLGGNVALGGAGAAKNVATVEDINVAFSTAAIVTGTSATGGPVTGTATLPQIPTPVRTKTVKA